jgi:peptidyl-prolyl cis-trans isomerase C
MIRSSRSPLIAALVAAVSTAALAADNPPAAKPAASTPAPAKPAAAAPAAAPAADDKPLPLDKIPAVVATVDGKPVSREDLIARANEASATLAQRGINLGPLTRDFYLKVLDDVIANALLYRDIAAQGIQPDAQELDRRYQEIRGQFPDEQKFNEMLQSRGYTPERLRRDLTEGLTVQTWVTQKLAPTIQIADAEVKKFYDENQAQMVDPERSHAAHILVAVPSGATPEQKSAAKKKADDLRAKVAGGADFAAVAKESSDDTASKPNGGDLGWVQHGHTPPPFETALFALKPGELSPVVETQFGFHLIKLIEHKDKSTVPFEQAKGRINEFLKGRAVADQVRAKVDALRAKSDVKILI